MDQQGVENTLFGSLPGGAKEYRLGIWYAVSPRLQGSMIKQSMGEVAAGRGKERVKDCR